MSALKTQTQAALAVSPGGGMNSLSSAGSTSPAAKKAKLLSTRTALEEMGTKGEFKRRDAAWRNWVSREKDSKFPPQKDRYHLYVAYACPWAHRTLMVRALKGLEDTISVTVVHPIWKKTRPDDPNDAHNGWVFGQPDGEDFHNTKGLGGPFPAAYPGNQPEPMFGVTTVRELYEKCEDTDGKYTVPILWDKKSETIVSNESSEIIQMLNSEFNEFAKFPDLDLSPSDLQDKIDAVNEWVYPTINNGVYRCGFATSQEAYDKAIDELTAAFDRVDKILQTQRYIAGDRLTLADIRLFVTLLRFDEVYAVYFQTNTRSVSGTPSILNYCRDIYQLPGVADTVNMEQIKAHYYCSHPTLNNWSIIPKGADFVKLLNEPHNRDKL